MRRLLLIIAALLIVVMEVAAQGGMWLPILAEQRISDMQKNGFKLKADDIYSVNKACMKDAVVLFGGGCTGEFVSKDGLIFTNHHCGKSFIQKHSSLSHDYLTHGYWAKNYDEELACEGLSVRVLYSMEEIPASKGNMANANERNSVVMEYKNIYGDDYEYSIESFYGGNIYYIFVYQEFNDVRLVAAPPSAIGNFGGDTDNWIWPRHGGDFSVFRVYANADNKPAEYSVDNKPYQPKSHFKISLKGVEEGDFTMVFGYPGITEEYLPSSVVEYYLKHHYPDIINVRKSIMELMLEAMNADRAVRINYTSKLMNVENYKKKLDGAVRGLSQYNVVEQKKQFEKKFTDIVASAGKSEEYGNILDDYSKLFSERMIRANKATVYFVTGIYQCPLFTTSGLMCRLKDLSTENIDFNWENDINSILHNLDAAYSGCDSVLERRIFTRLYTMFADSCKEYMPSNFADLYHKNHITSDSGFVETLYNTSIAASSERAKSFIEKLKNALRIANTKKRIAAMGELQKTLDNDLGAVLYTEFINMYFLKLASDIKKQDTSLDNLNKLYQKALLELMPSYIQFPDANSTLRFTYGKVSGFEPRDGVVYKCFTTLSGVMEKDNPDVYDYHVPERLKWLYSENDYGRYADKDGSLHVCFVASNHTTGGNSGSPVVNGNGELIGINFDRCWEGTMSDIMYDSNICRNISVDIRYVLFLIERLGKAQNIINELDIVE